MELERRVGLNQGRGLIFLSISQWKLGFYRIHSGIDWNSQQCGKLSMADLILHFLSSLKKKEKEEKGREGRKRRVQLCLNLFLIHFI